MVYLTWIATTIAIIGSILNAKQYRMGFYFWLVSNFMYVMINASWHIWGQAALFAFNMLICVLGLRAWMKEKK